MFYIYPTVNYRNLYYKYPSSASVEGEISISSKSEDAKACVPGGLHSVSHCACVSSCDSLVFLFLCVWSAHHKHWGFNLEGWCFMWWCNLDRQEPLCANTFCSDAKMSLSRALIHFVSLHLCNPDSGKETKSLRSNSFWTPHNSLTLRLICFSGSIICTRLKKGEI